MGAVRTWENLQAACRQIMEDCPPLASTLNATVLQAGPATGIAGLLGRALGPFWMPAETLIQSATKKFHESEALVEIVLEDMVTISTRNIEPGGAGSAWTWLAHRGFHVLAAHRLVNALWSGGQTSLALAIKAGTASLGVDIHPAAVFGRRIFLDHGVGFVVGETACVEDDVSIWHGVTLGSTLMAHGDRHPKIRRGAVIGAGATVLGNIEIGEGAIIASGAVVVRPVLPFTTVAGNPAMLKPGYRHPFGYKSPTASKVVL